MRRKPTWMLRPPRALDTTPKPGKPKSGWLKALNISSLNWKPFCSAKKKFLSSERSKLTTPSPRITPRPPVPNVNAAGCAKAAVSNQRASVRSDDFRQRADIRSARLQQQGFAGDRDSVSGRPDFELDVECDRRARGQRQILPHEFFETGLFRLNRVTADRQLSQ